MTDPAERLFRLLSDGRTTLAQVRAGIEEYGAAERAAGREEARERLRVALDDIPIRWPYMGATPYIEKELLAAIFAALPAGRGGALFPSNRTVSNAIPEDEAIFAKLPATPEDWAATAALETHLFVDSRFGPNRCRDCDHPREWHPQPGPAPADEADRLLVALVDPQDEQLDTEGFCEHGLLSGVGCSEWEHKPWDAARAYIERKGLA